MLLSSHMSTFVLGVDPGTAHLAFGLVRMAPDGTASVATTSIHDVRLDHHKLAYDPLKLQAALNDVLLKCTDIGVHDRSLTVLVESQIRTVIRFQRSVIQVEGAIKAFFSPATCTLKVGEELQVLSKWGNDGPVFLHGIHCVPVWYGSTFLVRRPPAASSHSRKHVVK
eukprot:gene9315-16446_t